VATLTAARTSSAGSAETISTGATIAATTATTEPAARFETSAARARAARAAAESTPGPRTHVIAAGDTLAKISLQYYGTPDRWTEIVAANRDILRDEKSLVIGRVIRIP
jgi:nucleoid-associated protein YgaU